MKYLIFLIVASVFVVQSAFSSVFVLEGVYQGKDIYVQNPFGSEGVGFCVFEVQVNGKVTSDEINSSAFAVDLSMYEFELGDEVVITIRSKSDCTPKIINPDAISPVSSCEISNVQLSPQGELSWNTVNENGKLPFIIEHFKWNKWVQVGSVLGEGKAEESAYKVQVNLPGGENRLRIKQKDHSGDHITDEVMINSAAVTVTLKSERVTDYVEFSGKTHFEIYNSYGELVKSGYNSRFKISNFEKGTYYLNYDQTFGVEIRKK